MNHKPVAWGYELRITSGDSAASIKQHLRPLARDKLKCELIYLGDSYGPAVKYFTYDFRNPKVQETKHIHKTMAKHLPDLSYQIVPYEAHGS